MTIDSVLSNGYGDTELVPENNARSHSRSPPGPFPRHVNPPKQSPAPRQRTTGTPVLPHQFQPNAPCAAKVEFGRAAPAFQEAASDDGQPPFPAVDGDDARAGRSTGYDWHYTVQALGVRNLAGLVRMTFRLSS